MKITLGYSVNYNGYLNLGIIKTLDPFVENSECEEILATDILNYIEAENTQQYITHLVSKLRHGGKIILGGRDITAIAVAVLTMPADSDIQTLNSAIFGSAGDRPICCHLTVNHVASILQGLGLKVTRKTLDAGEFLVEAIRP